MPLETATYISDLVTSNPAASDGLNNADDHMRMIKGAVKATFPNITGALNATHTALDATVTTVGTTGVSLLADAGAFFKTNTTDGITNPSAGEIDIKLAGSVFARFMSSTNTLAITNLTTSGTIASTGAISGPGTTPIGGMIMWLTDTLPTGAGTWAWANGQAINRTTYATLFGLWGTTYGAGDGSTTFNLINMQEVAPVGKSTMGGAGSPGLLTSVSAGLKAVLGSLFGSDTHVLTSAEMPSHYHAAGIYDPTHQHPCPGGASQGGGGTSVFIPIGASYTSYAATGVRVNSSNGIDTTYSTGGGAAHSILGPSRVVNFIIRVA